MREAACARDFSRTIAVAATAALAASGTAAMGDGGGWRDDATRVALKGQYDDFAVLPGGDDDDD